MDCFERWQGKLFERALADLGVSNFFGERLKFELDTSKIEGGICNRCGCNRYRGGGYEHPEGYVIATDFIEEQGDKTCLRLFIRLPDTKGMGGMPHYLQFDGETWTWDEWCGGYPDDRHFSRHAGKIVRTTPVSGLFGLGEGRDDIICPHPEAENLEQMLRQEQETGKTDRRLERARWCSSCQVMLAIIANYVPNR